MAIDLVGDNNLEAGEDYSADYALTPECPRRCELSVPNQGWGRPGFTYTDAAVYQHKVHQYRIPLQELGIDAGTNRAAVNLAFEAYVTVTPEEPPTVGGQTIPPSTTLIRWLRPTLAVIAAAVIVTTTAFLHRRKCPTT